jgi:predicted nuclease of predicted toxin-antitoxin system
VTELSPGIADDAVLSRSREAQAVLLTADKDFGELVFRQRRTHCGVVLVRLAGLDSGAKAGIVAAAFREHAEELGSGFATLSARLLRVRKQRP